MQRKPVKSRDSQHVEKVGESYFRVEPALLAHTLVTLLIYIVYQEFMMEKVCEVNLGFSNTVCTALKSKDGSAGETFHAENVEVQKMVGTLLMVRTILENFFPLFLVILIGAWSDKYGRKLPMLFVIGTYVFQNVLLLFCVYFQSLGGWSVAIVTSLIPALAGNNACFNMAAFSYVAQNAPPEKRTARTGMASSMIFLGVILGLGLGGAVTQSGLGFAHVFLLGVLAEVGIFLYILFAMEDHPNQNSQPIWKMILEIFNKQHLKDAFEVVRKPRPGNTRKQLYILLAAYFCAFAPIMGEMTVYFLFGRYHFNWDGAQMGFFLTYKNVVGFAGNFVTMEILTNRMKLSDPIVGICGAVSTVLASVYFAFVNQDILMYLGPFLALLSGANMVVPRSILSQIIPTEELGKVNSFLGCIDSIAPLMAGPIYSMVYTHTLETLPGTFFLVTALINVPPLLGYLYFLNTKEGVKKN